MPDISQSQPRRGFMVYTPAELEDAEFQKPRFLDGDEYIRHPGRILVWGNPGSYKTWWTLSKVVEIAHRGARVLAMLGEGDPHTVRERLRGIAKAQGCHYRELDPNLLVSFDILWLESPEGRQFIQKVIIPCNPDVVLVDPLISYFGLDENNTEDVKKLLQVFNEEFLARGISIMLVHHGRKTGKDVASSPRGSSAFSGWADVELQFEAVREQEGVFCVRTEKRRDDRRIGDPEYMRWEARPEIAGYDLVKIGPEAVKAMQPQKFKQKPASEGPKAMATAERRIRAVEFLQQCGSAGTRIRRFAQAVNCSGTAAQRILEDLYGSNVARPIETETGTVWVLQGADYAPTSVDEKS